MTPFTLPLALLSALVTSSKNIYNTGTVGSLREGQRNPLFFHSWSTKNGILVLIKFNLMCNIINEIRNDEFSEKEYHYRIAKGPSNVIACSIHFKVRLKEEKLENLRHRPSFF